MLGITFHTMKWILVIVTGISWGLPFFLTFYIMADVPSSQVQTVWRRTLKTKRKPFMDIFNMALGNDEARLEKEERERDKYRVFINRLGLRTSYSELKRQGKKIMITSLVVSTLLIIIGIASEMGLLTLIGIVGLPMSYLLSMLPLASIESRIKNLDRAILFELPIFIDNVRVMRNNLTLESVLETYLPNAGPLRQDIILTLASLKSKTNVNALTDMSNRMQRGGRLEEVANMIDLMKSLYSGTNVERCCINLEILGQQINDVHVRPYIDKKKDAKLFRMQIAVMVGALIIFILYTAPMLIEMAIISKDLL